MGKKKLHTFSDLYEFFEKQNKDCVFSARETNTQFLIGMNADMKFSKSDDDSLLPVHLQACHTGENVNHCFISDETMTNALSTLVNKPILGYIYKDDDGEFQFRTHDMHSENGETVYDEIMVGFLPESCNPHIEFDEEKKKNFVEVDGYIVEEYTKAADILRREEECQVSVEMAVNEMAYDAKTHILNITDFVFKGVTILGRFEDGTEVQPGMAGSNIVIRDELVSFSETQTKLEELSRQVAELQHSLSIKNSEKGGTEGLMKFDELLKKYNKTAEEVTFDIEGLSDEELEAKFAEEFGETEAEVEAPTVEEKPVPTEDNSTEEEVTPTEESEAPAEGDAGKEGEEADTPAPEEGGEEQPVADITASIKTGENIKTFELSLNEKDRALHDLVNITYGDVDNDYYSTTSYEDSGYLIMESWFTGRAYKQGFERNGDEYALVGERVEVFSIWVTEEEKTQFESMKNSYDSMVTKLQNYENEPAKMDVLNGDEYAGVRNSEEFEALMSIDAHFELSVDEVKAQADSILLNAAKNKSLDFAAQNAQTTRKAIQFKKNKCSGRYGNMFSK